LRRAEIERYVKGMRLQRGGTDGLSHERGPVGRREELAVLDVVGAVLHVAIAIGDVDLQQVLDAVLEVAAEMMRELQLYTDHQYYYTT